MPNVIVYSKPNCMQCSFTKKWLTNHNVPFEEVDITKDPEALSSLKDLGFMSMPVVSLSPLTKADLKQEDVAAAFTGFDIDKLEEMKRKNK